MSMNSEKLESLRRCGLISEDDYDAARYGISVEELKGIKENHKMWAFKIGRFFRNYKYAFKKDENGDRIGSLVQLIITSIIAFVIIAAIIALIVGTYIAHNNHIQEHDQIPEQSYVYVSNGLYHFEVKTHMEGSKYSFSPSDAQDILEEGFETLAKDTGIIDADINYKLLSSSDIAVSAFKDLGDEIFELCGNVTLEEADYNSEHDGKAAKRIDKIAFTAKVKFLYTDHTKCVLYDLVKDETNSTTSYEEREEYGSSSSSSSYSSSSSSDDEPYSFDAGNGSTGYYLGNGKYMFKNADGTTDYTDGFGNAVRDSDGDGVADVYTKDSGETWHSLE